MPKKQRLDDAAADDWVKSAAAKEEQEKEPELPEILILQKEIKALKRKQLEGQGKEALIRECVAYHYERPPEMLMPPAPKLTGKGKPQVAIAHLSDTQLGKALDDDTPIFCVDGWKRHGDLRPGDHVFGSDGLPKLVTHVTGSSLQECYRVEFDKDAGVVASGDHLWQGYRLYNQGEPANNLRAPRVAMVN